MCEFTELKKVDLRANRHLIHLVATDQTVYPKCSEVNTDINGTVCRDCAAIRHGKLT